MVFLRRSAFTFAVAIVWAWLPMYHAAAEFSMPPLSASSDSAQLDPMTLEELQAEKLRQEILSLRRTNERGLLGGLPIYAPFLTALAALAGIFITLWKHIAESSRQKDLDRQQREAEREQREKESRRSLDEQFNRVANSLGADSEAIQAGAAVSMALFSRHGYEDYYASAFMLMLANLKIEHTPAVRSLLINSFADVARKYLPDAGSPGLEETLDFSHAVLTGADLSELNLANADVGYAQLQRVNFSDAVLEDVRGYGANCDKARFSRANLRAARFHKASFRECQFHDATLIDAKMREADLRRVQFQRAKLQGAHFENALLDGARFHQADLNDAYFSGASGLTTATLKSVVTAYNWEAAHFDAPVREQLDELAKQREEGKTRDNV